MSRRGWYAGYAAFSIVPPAGTPLGRTVTSLVPAERLREPLQMRVLALAAGGGWWLLVSLDASLLCTATATAIRSALAARGWPAMVVASGARSAPILSAQAEETEFRRQVIALAEAAGALATRRASPAALSFASAPLEIDEELLPGHGPLLPYVDLVSVNAAPDRPRVVLASAALPRLLDPFRGDVNRGCWARAEEVLAAQRREPTVVLPLPVSAVQEPAGSDQRTGREARVAERLAASLALAASAAAEPVPPRLGLVEREVTLPSLPLPERYDIRKAADRAEFGCEDGTLAQRLEKSARWRWLERLYEASMAGRTADLPVRVSQVSLGEVTILGVSADLSDRVALLLAEQLPGEPVLVVSGADGRALALLHEAERATLAGGRELEPFTDLWVAGAGAASRLAAGLVAEEA